MIIKNGAKMSKNLGNVVSPDDMVDRYGADSTRMYTLFATSPDRELDWQDEGVAGVQRFLARIYRFFVQNANPTHPEWRNPVPANLEGPAREIQRRLHRTIKRVTEDFKSRWHFNTSIAGLMELTNQLLNDIGRWQETRERQMKLTGKADPVGMADIPVPLIADALRKSALMLAPFAPYLAHELWEMTGESSNLLKAAWPKYDPALAADDNIEIPIQFNGKLRSRIVVPAAATDDEVKAAALADEKVQAAVAGKQIVKVIVVPKKLVNIVVK